MSDAATDFGIEAASLTAIRRLCEHTPGLERLWIFGSGARGEHRERSDIDLVADALQWKVPDSLAFTDALKRLPMVYPVDCSWWQDTALSDEFRRQIERDRQVLWAPRRSPVDARALDGATLKEFQADVLTGLGSYIDELKRRESKAAQQLHVLRAMEGMEDAARDAADFPKKAWDALKAAGQLPEAYAARPHSNRFDGADRAIPNVCLKVPTGGGKTLLAAASVARVFNGYLNRHTGLVLWVVPNEAIYRQTLGALSDRDHLYRQILNVAGAGRVKVLEKQSPLTKLDLDSHLCVMVLMLQSAARQSKETLRFFRDRGNVLGFLPREDDIEAHWQLLREVPNLGAYAAWGGSAEEARAQKGSIIKSSLGNVMRLVRPMVVVDEGHHASSENALRTLDGFNPCFRLQLSATPRAASAKGPGLNILVDVRGTHLDAAEMIKLPIKVEVRGWNDWQSCLGAAAAKLDALQVEADALRAETARYLRPILLVQVERTGADLRDAGFIHAEDAKAYLLQMGLKERQIAIKTAEKNDLAQPENIDLMSPTCEVRAIITKQALQEGWDCPFAYVLCALAAGRNPAAMTQLVGRILRLPQVTKTGREALDACYVLCHDARTGEVVKAIKSSLEQEGMGDLAASVMTGGETNADVAAGFTEVALAAASDSLIERLRIDLEAERDRLAQGVFARLASAGRIEFRLRADHADYELPRAATLALADKPKAFGRSDGRGVDKSLLEPALQNDMNQLEAAFAGYLDEQAALRWWHRNVAKAQYGLQGWRRHKVYPDFVFARVTGAGGTQLVVMETKGLHLQGPDTAYKQALFDRLSAAFRDERAPALGKLVLEGEREDLVCDLVFDSAWRGAMNERYFKIPAGPIEVS